LPEAKEDNQLDGENLEKWPMLLDVNLDLDIELNQAVHGDGDRSGFNDENLD